MEVCSSCHEKDRNVIKCPVVADGRLNGWDHDGPKEGQCDVCGVHTNTIYHCRYYSEYVNKRSGK